MSVEYVVKRRKEFSRSEESDLGIASADKTGKLDTVGENPAGEFLSSNCVGVLTGVETSEESRALKASASKIEAEAD